MPSPSARLSASLLVGEAFGDYTLLRKLATGGMAEVFLARRRSALPGFSKLVAIKRMLPHLAEDPEFITMFLDEARTASHLNHPNIVQIFDVGEALGTLFLGMEYLDGVPLMTVLQCNMELRSRQLDGGTQRFLPVRPEDRPLDPLYSAAIGVQICQGLHYAHELTLNGDPMGLVHRDVSPQNLMLTFGGVAKVLDFGIAKAAGRASVTRAGAVKGKLRYMAPEQFLFQPVDRRTDVYSLGVALYELATATRAYSGEDWEIVQQVQKGQLPPAQSVRAEVPAQLSQVLSRAMAANPDDRYPSAASLGEALLGVMRSLGRVLTAADLAQMAQARFGGERIDISPYTSAEHRALPAPIELTSGSIMLEEGDPPTAMLPAEQTRLAAPLPRPASAVSTATVGSAPPPLPTGWLLHALLSLTPKFRPRHFWLYPVATSMMLASVLSLLGGGLAHRLKTRVAREAAAAAGSASRRVDPAPPVPSAPKEPPVRPAVAGPPVVAVGPPAVAPAPALALIPAPPVRPAQRVVRRESRQSYGYLVIDSKPTWARVYAYGRLLGQTPIVKRTLPAGWLTLKVVNGQSRAERTVQVHIKKGEVTTTLVRWQ